MRSLVRQMLALLRDCHYKSCLFGWPLTLHHASLHNWRAPSSEHLPIVSPADVLLSAMFGLPWSLRDVAPTWLSRCNYFSVFLPPASLSPSSFHISQRNQQWSLTWWSSYCAAVQHCGAVQYTIRRCRRVSVRCDCDVRRTLSRSVVRLCHNLLPTRIAVLAKRIFLSRATRAWSGMSTWWPTGMCGAYWQAPVTAFYSCFSRSVLNRVLTRARPGGADINPPQVFRR